MAAEETTQREVISDKEFMLKIQGVSDMLFEVIYGAGEGLHSKYAEVINSLIEYYQSLVSSKPVKATVEVLLRCLFLKLVNEVDTEKQQPLFNTIEEQFKH